MQSLQFIDQILNNQLQQDYWDLPPPLPTPILIAKRKKFKKGFSYQYLFFDQDVIVNIQCIYQLDNKSKFKLISVGEMSAHFNKKYYYHYRSNKYSNTYINNLISEKPGDYKIVFANDIVDIVECNVFKNLFNQKFTQEDFSYDNYSLADKNINLKDVLLERFNLFCSRLDSCLIASQLTKQNSKKKNKI